MQNIGNQSLDLRAAILSGDLEKRNFAYQQLWQNEVVKNTIKRWVKSYSPKGVDAEDILQEALLKLDALVLDGTFQGRSAITTFLLGIALNMIRDKARLVKRYYFKGIITDNDCPDPETVADQLLHYEEEDARMKLERELERLTLELREECRTALRMQYYENRCMKEIAVSVNVKNSDQAKKLASVCRQQLRRLCEQSPVIQNLLQYLYVKL